MLRHAKFDPSMMKGRILDIGCGRKKLPGSVGLDCRAHPGVDIVADLNEKLPIETGSYDVVHADQVLEHVQNMIPLMEEIWRILAPNGILVAHTPYFRSNWAHIDPTHVRGFTINTLDYFVKDTLYNDGYSFGENNFSKKEVYLDTDYRSDPFRIFFSNLALRWPARFENSLLSFLYPFQQITYVLTK